MAAKTSPKVDAGALAAQQLRSLYQRIALLLVAVWIVCGSTALLVPPGGVRRVALTLGVVATLAAAGFVFWVLRRTRAAQGVASILAGVETKEERQRALEQLDQRYKSDDEAAVFARAQLLMQDDPRKALEALERIDLTKVMANVADEARGQRAMIHLALGEVPRARDLVDGISLSRHQDPRGRAMLAAVIAEAWARSGQAKRALDTLSALDDADPVLESLRPQLFRAQAYAHAHASDLPPAKKALRRLVAIDPRLLAGFLDRRSHPLLQKEAKKLLSQAGMLPQRVQFQRRLS